MVENDTKQFVDPVSHVKPYFTKLKARDISILIGTIILKKTVKFKLLQSLLNLKKIEVEEKIGRLLQTDLLEGEFSKDGFTMTQLNYNITRQQIKLNLDDRILLAYLKARFIVSFSELEKAFGLNYESVIHILSKFITKGLLSIELQDNNSIQVILHYQLPKKSIDEISNSEKEIIGYAILRQTTTFEEITSNLDIPEHRVQTVIVDMILSDLILCNFNIIHSRLKGIELLIEIEHFLSIFPTRSVEVLSDIERQIVGYISLRKIVSIREITVNLRITRSVLLQIISRLTSTREFPFSLSKKGYIKALFELSVARTITIDQLIASSLFNYRMLLGIISTEEEVTLSLIKKKMNVSKFEILRGIIDLYLTGHVRGYFKNQEHFILESVEVTTGESGALQTWERIILGALISERVISWPKIAALLEIDRDTAREKAYSFISRGISKAIAKEKALSMLEIPALPPLVQIVDLTLNEQQILGYFLTKNRISLKEIRTLTGLSNIEVYRKIYLLIGSGLIVARRNKNEFLVIEKRYYEPQQAVNELNPLLQKLIQLIEDKTISQNTFKMKDFAHILNRSTKEITKDLSQLVALGYYKLTFKGKTVTKLGNLFKVKGKPVCFECGTLLDDYNIPCPGCNAIPPICSVCKGAISSNDLIVSCPFCSHKSHSTHLMKWLKIKSRCPICKKSLSQQQLIKADN